ncbi:MAG: DUF2339 domain-containing protein [Terracidiphilus sp.]
MNPNLPGSLEDQVAELHLRVGRLEEALASRGVIVNREEAAPAPRAPGAMEAHAAPSAPAAKAGAPQAPPFVPAYAPVAPPRFGMPEHAKAEDTRSLENRIGSQWFNRIGILAMLIGVAWFLKYAFDNHWIGPLGRVLIGLLAGAALIVWSGHFRTRGFAAFAYSLQAIGSGTLYLSLWAAFSVYALMPAGAAFAAMILVTAFNGFMSCNQDSELLALYAIAGGLSTPLLVSTGGNHEITLFTYLLVLDAAALILVALRPWSRLLFVAFVGTAVFIAGWWFEFYSQVQAARTAFFLTCFFLIFAFAPRLVRLNLNERGGSSAWDALALVAMPVFNAGLGFLAFYSLPAPSTADWAGPWIAVALAAFYLLLLKLPARGVLQPSSAVLSSLHLAAAVVFLTLAIPLKTHGRWLTIGWLAEGAALLWVSSRVRSMLLRVFALVCLALGLIALLTVNPPAATTPFFNQRFGTYLVAIAVFVFVGWLARNSRDAESPEPGLSWPALAGAAVLAVNLLILLAIGWEIHSYWWFLRWRGDWKLMGDYRMYAQFTYSAFFMLFGAVLLSAGFWRRSAFLRWQALVLLAVAVAKVFLVDVSQLSRGFRIVSFLVLGAVLLAVSFAYQRDWLNLRGEGEKG